MAQHDYVIDNQASASARADLNSLFQAIASQNSGATAPTTTYANMIWYDTANDLLKMRNEANSAWITLGTLDQALNTFTAPSVNGKTVGTLTAAGGIAYATSSTALAAIGAGTAGQVLLSGGAGAPTWSNFSVIDYQAFTASGTWTKPAGISANAVVLVEMWGGGGGGGKGGSTNGNASGGGGGGFARFAILASALGATQSVTVGAGGAGGGTSSVGTAGGLSQFYNAIVYGGAGGGSGGSAGNRSAASGGSWTSSRLSGDGGGKSPDGGTEIPPDQFGGGAGSNTGGASTVGAYWGGGGGVSSSGTGVRTSVMGGSGGLSGSAGTAPAGGGGGKQYVNDGTTGGAGARGEVHVWTIG